MGNFKNKKTEIKKDENDFITFKDLAEACLNVTPEGGLNVSDMKNRLNVLAQLDKSNGTIKITGSAEEETLKQCVASMKWRIMHKDVVEFVEAVEKM
jgi:hypothetical protein